MTGVHVSKDFAKVVNGWWYARCACGFRRGPFPDAETACDVLMGHAFAVGEKEGRKEG